MSEQFDVILGSLDTEVDVTIADSTGVDPSVLLALRGEKGDTGSPGAPGQNGYTPIKGVDYFDGADGYTPIKGVDYFDGQDGRDGTDGTDGEDGVGIVSITKTATVGLVDTYTILYSDGTTSTFDVTNGQNGSGSVADVWVDGFSVLDGDTAKIDLTGKSDVGHTHTMSAITDFPSLATVATSGSYNDLSNKPTIPTKTSDITNDSGFITPSALPTKVSDLTNDAGYITDYTETDPTVPSWAKAPSKPSYTASEISGLINMFYPVGSYYETSDTSFDPNVAWGGTAWDLEIEGQVHISAGSVYTVAGALTNTSDGGSEDAIVPYHTHTYTRPTVVSGGGGHKHSLNQRNAGTSGSRATDNVTYGASGHDYQTSNAFVSNDGTHTHTLTGGGIGYEGTDPDGANMPPYIIVNRWHRTA